MAIGGAFLGGGVELVPAGSCKLELEAYTDNATVSATFTISGGGNTYTVTSGTDGRASKLVPSGVTYTVSATVTGYTAPPSQTVIAESSSIKYVRFDAQLKKAQGDISTLQADVDKAEGDISTLKTDVGNAQGDISTLQADVKRAQSTADSKADTTVATQSANGLMSSADKTKLDGVDSALAGKVSKSGDTMSGLLHLTGGCLLSTTPDKAVTDVPIFSTMREIDVSSVNSYQVAGSINMHWSGWKYSGGMSNWRDASFTAMNIIADSSAGSQTILTVWQPNDGNQGWVSCPSWSVGTNDNSDKIMTIKMANSLPSLMHTTGNENVSGNKTFLGEINFKGGVEVNAALPFIDFHFNQSENDYSVRLINGADGLFTIDVRNNDLTKQAFMNFIANDGVIVIPSTPSHVAGNQIATADWSLSKFQRKITYGTGDPPSGGQAGDIYIKI